jgi:hypothetical protein
MHNWKRAGLLALSAVLGGTAHAARVEFNRDVRPIFSDRCFSCHGPDSVNRQAGLRLDQEAAAKAKLADGKTPIVPGDAERSEVYRRISSNSKALRMPPAYAGHDPLTPKEVETIRRWLDEGAVWQKHWAFLAPVRPAPPQVKHSAWVRNAVDAFIVSRLEREGLEPSPEADKVTLLRRVTLDLTGLPPAPSEVDAFLKDTAPGAYERVVDRLLSSTHYAERMAIRWLEAARYADTNGYQSDGERSMWRWRDWVIGAFDRNMPFDKFTIEQIAGDLLPNATLDDKIATAFHRNHRTSAEGGIVEEEFRTEYVADRVETTSTVWLGITLGCARCHDHKYDPFLQKDFYSMFAFFNNVPERGLVYNFGNEEPFIKAPTPENTARLAELDAKLAGAEKHWDALQGRLRKEQHRWEKNVRSQQVDWTVPGATDLHLPAQTMRLDGVHDVESPDKLKFDYKDPFTFAAWIKPDSPNGVILSKSEDYFEGEGHQWFLMDGKLRLHITRRFTDISLRMETVQPLKLHEWQHVAITYDGYRKGAGVHMYVNGEPWETKILFDELTYPLGPKEPWRVGAGAGDKYRFKGEIKGVRVYKTALTPEQVSVLPLKETISEIAAMPAGSRNAAQQHKLRFCFLDKYATQEIRSGLHGLEEARTERRKYYEAIPTVMIMVEGKPRETHLLRRGAYDQPGEKVTARTPTVLPPFKPEWPDNRLGLAKWLVDRSNPLTARVTVNRFWAMLFGTGLVKTVTDFGSQGEWPVHQDLLDWLAVEFMDSGWNVKGILKTMVMSNTYRQESRVTPELLQKDPENRLLARGPRFRLPAEMIRDQALAASGLLVDRVGGPSVKPYQPPGLWQELTGGRGYVEDSGAGLYRRSLYTYWKRTIAPPAMITFDSPTRETCIVRETRTNTPLQALNLMNDETYLEAARKLAERAMREGGSAEEQRVRFLFRTVLARAPKDREDQVLTKTLEQFRARYAAHPETAKKFLNQGKSPRDPSLNPVELAAYTGISSLILNLDETVTKE